MPREGTAVHQRKIEDQNGIVKNKENVSPGIKNDLKDNNNYDFSSETTTSNVKNSLTLNGYVFKYSKRRATKTHLDILELKSDVRGSVFLGWYRGGIVSAMSFMVFLYLSKYVSTHHVSVFDWESINDLTQHAILTLFLWAVLFCWSFFAYLNVKYLVLNEWKNTSRVAQHTLNIIPYAITASYLLFHNVGPISGQFTVRNYYYYSVL